MFESAEQTGIAVSGHGSGYPDEENKEPGTGDDSRKKDCRLFSGNLQQTADRGSDLFASGSMETGKGGGIKCRRYSLIISVGWKRNSIRSIGFRRSCLPQNVSAHFPVKQKFCTVFY